MATERRDEYVAFARQGWPHFARHSALHMVECWGEDVKEGHTTDFIRATRATPDETVVFSWIVWPDRATADAAEQAMQTDPAMAELREMPFDGTRMVFGGFVPVFDSGGA